MYDQTFKNVQNTGPDIVPHMKWAVSLVIAWEHVAQWIRHWTQDQIPNDSYVLKCQANFAFHTASVHPAVMGRPTWCTDPRLDQQLQAALAPTLPGER